MRQKSKYRCSLSFPPFFEASIQISRCFVMMQIGYFPLNPNHQIEQADTSILGMADQSIDGRGSFLIEYAAF